MTIRRLQIDGDDQLRDLRGLSSLRQLSNLLLERNAALTSLDGLEQIHDMSGTLELLNNTALASTAGPSPRDDGPALRWADARAMELHPHGGRRGRALGVDPHASRTAAGTLSARDAMARASP